MMDIVNLVYFKKVRKCYLSDLTWIHAELKKAARGPPYYSLLNLQVSYLLDASDGNTLAPAGGGIWQSGQPSGNASNAGTG